MTWVKAVWVLKSLLETKINVDYIRLLKKKKKEPTIWPDQEDEFPADIQKLINAKFGQQQPTSTLLSHPNRLSNPFQSGSCQKKSSSASQTGWCVSEVDLGFSAWMKEGGAGECPAGALFRVALCTQQAAVSLNNPA